jgi:exopolysaccharide biosynthesis polyprenyl glycosylphosphotransferase
MLQGTEGRAAVALPEERRRPLAPGLNWLFEDVGYTYTTLAVDAALLLGAVMLADAAHPAAFYLPLLLFGPLALALLASRRLYDPHAQIGRLDRAAGVAGSIAIAAISIAGLVELTRPDASEADLIAAQFCFATVLLLAWRMLFATLRARARRGRRCGRPTLVVGSGDVGARIERHLDEIPVLGLIPVGFVDSDPASPAELARRHRPVLGTPAEFDAIVTETDARHAIFAFQIEPDHTLRRLVRRCRDRGLTMGVVPRLFDDATNRMVLEHVGGIPVFELRQVDPKGWQFAIKHGLDRLAAAALLVLLSPILAGTALAVRLSSPGPVLFRQRRVGRDGQVFDVLKFRSMRYEPEGAAVPVLAPGAAPGGVEGNDRRTRVGRFIRAWSLDELPQLINVLRGEMSIVGPRPERPELVGEFAEHVRRYDERHRVRSGITGWAQVHGLGPGTSLEDRAEWDNWYIQNWSLWLDLKILLMTIPAVLRPSE